MADYFIEDSTLSSIADAIRAHIGDIGILSPQSMAAKIHSEFNNVKSLIARSPTIIAHSGVKSIGPYAFYNYNNLERVNFPNCSAIDNTAFIGCMNITNATLGVSELTTSFPLQSAVAVLTTVNFPHCINIVGNAFAQCAVLSEVTLPACATASINAFAGCAKLQTVTIGFSEFTKANNALMSVASTLTTVIAPMCTTVDASAFAHYSKIASISFPLCTSLGDYAFGNCESLVSATFPACVTLGPNALADCTGLSAVGLPVCTSIGVSAFRSCISLISISCPNCQTIDTGAFTDCSSLSAVDFPSCIEIGYSAFYNCTKLSEIILGGSSIVELADIDAFAHTPIIDSSYLGDFGSVYVPASLVSRYKNTINWTEIASRITAIPANNNADSN